MDNRRHILSTLKAVYHYVVEPNSIHIYGYMY
jgi:hypothetical protein